LNVAPGSAIIMAMTLTLDLPKELVKELSVEADRLGLSLSEYALRILTAVRSQEAPPKTGADLVAYWQAEGLIGTRPEIADSQAYAREIRRAAEKRKLS
jgi:hypothetical protein